MPLCILILMSEPLEQIETCRNCASPVRGKFCSECGQENINLVVPVGDLVGDIFDEFFKFDSRLFLTIGLLIRRPGFLTNEYIAGKRARYLAPFRLYFTLSAIYFLVSGFLHINEQMSKYVVIEAQKTAVTRNSPTAAAASPKPSLPSILSKPTAKAETKVRFQHAMEKYLAWYAGSQGLLIFLMVPFGALTLKLFNVRSGRLYIEHLVFCAHFTAFTFLLSILALPLLIVPDALTPMLAMVGITIAMVIYVSVSIRTVYHLSIGKTLAQSVGLCGAYLLSNILFGSISFIYFFLTS